MHTCSGPTCDFTQDRTTAHLLHHVRNRITTHLKPEDMRIMPKRADFQSPVLVRRMADTIAKMAPLHFMPHTNVDSTEWVRGEDGERSAEYRLHINGILPDSSRVQLQVHGALPVFGVCVSDGEKPAKFVSAMIGRIASARINTVKHEIVELYRIRTFQKAKSKWMIITFPTLKYRTDFRRLIEQYNQQRIESGLVPLETCEDDASNYFAVIARKWGISTAGWNTVMNYTPIDPPPNIRYAFSVSIEDIRPTPPAELTAAIDARDEWGDALKHGRVMEAQWDIETYRRIVSAQPPTPADRDYTIFTLCTAYSWHSDMPTSLVVGFVDGPCRVRPEHGIIVFICRNERETLGTWSAVHSRLNPDIISAFNGGNFDWPVTIEKMRRYGQLCGLDNALGCNARPRTSDADVRKWCFRSETIKIDAENNHELAVVAQFNGVIDVDVLPTMLRLFPRAEVPKLASLNFFLSKMKLPSKEDMPYTRMFRIYERAAKMRSLSCHCIVGGRQAAPLQTREHALRLPARESDDGAARESDDGIVRKMPALPIPVKCTMGEETFNSTCECHNHVRELDYRLREGMSYHDDECYSDDLHPEIDDRCCYCTKYNRNLDDMGDVVYYCAVDCIRPHELCVKRLIVVDKRELSTLSYVSLYDSYYRADGMKVRNLIGNAAHRFGIAFSNSRPDVGDSDRTHYPGAWVGFPEKTLNREDPVSGVDYSSLYPSLMMCYNLSLDMLVRDRATANALIAEGYNLHHIGPFTYECGEKKGASTNRKFTVEGWTVRHSGILEPEKDTRTVTTYRRRAKYTLPDGSTLTAYDDESLPPRPGTLSPGTMPAEIASHLRGKSPVPALDVAYTYEPVYGRDRLPGERMGLLPYVVRGLFERRKPVKARWQHYVDLLDQMEKAGTHSIYCKFTGGTISHEECEQNMNYVDAKQKAIKVLSNTFYGESGNYRSPIFEVICAAGTTLAGVANITRVRHMVERLGCHLHYGDTDSLYLSPPRRMFRSMRDEYELAMATAAREAAQHGIMHADPRAVATETDSQGALTPAAKYKAARTAARLAYWEVKVRETMRYMNELTAEISLFLMRNNGTTFLNMAYEEVGMPTWFAGMKKYIMAAHMKVINFYPNTYMTRGMEYIKQGQTPFAATINPKMVRNIMIADNELEPIDLVTDLVREYPFDKIPADQLALKSRYKPDKKTVPVHTFVARMRILYAHYTATDPVRAALYTIPEPGDKFTYIIAKKPITYNLRGNKIEPKKGDKMEFLRVYNALNGQPDCDIELDIDWYMKSAFIGVFARYIAYEPQFQCAGYDLTDREQYKIADAKSIDAASAYLGAIYDARVGFVKTAAAAVGREYRSAFTRLNKAVKTRASESLGRAGILYHEIAETALEKPLGKTLIDMARENPPHPNGGDIAAALIEKADGDPWRVWTYYVNNRSDKSICAIRMRKVCERITALEREIVTHAPRITASAQATNTVLTTFINHSRTIGADGATPNDQAIDSICSVADADAIRHMYSLWSDLRALEGERMTIDEMTNAVMLAKAGNVAAVPADIATRGYRNVAREEARIMARTPISAIEWA